MGSISRIAMREPVGRQGRDDAGLFTWEVDADLVYADSAVATLFTFGRGQAECGLPILEYINRIDARDRPKVAKALHDAIQSGSPYQEDYRILQDKGPPLHVMSVGHCFRGGAHRMTYFSGIIFPISELAAAEDPLSWHCLKAYEIASRGGNHAVAATLRGVLDDLNVHPGARERR